MIALPVILATIVLFISTIDAGYPPKPGPWTAAAWRPVPDPEDGPRLDSTAIQANGGRFWMGKDPSTYCPSNVTGLDCAEYPGGQTIFIGGNDTLSLDVGVPGGQQSKLDWS